MQKRVIHPIAVKLLWSAWAAAILLAPLAPSSAVGQSPAAPAASIDAASIDVVERILERGRKLETNHRWGEALTHYEDAVREYPDNRALKQRLDLAKVYYDLTRRYADVSFRKLLVTTDQREALDLHGEILQKIESHYVDSPDYAALVRRGTLALDVALSEPEFVRRNLPDVPAGRIDEFRRELRTLNPGNVRNRGQARAAVARIAQYAQQRLGIAPAAVILEYTCGATGGLDPYSTFLTRDQLDEIYSQIEGNFVGLGIELKAAGGALRIVNVITGSPALRGGLVSGDTIIAIDGRSTADLTTDQAANLLQGAEGSSVDLMLRSAAGGERRVRVRREHVEVPSVDDVKIVDRAAGIAYLNLTSFQKTTIRELDAALWKLHREGMKSLVMDLRGNPGGLLTAAVDVADKFVERGSIVSTRGRSSREDLNYSAHRVGTWRVPLVVLIDGDSASASEIFAGAIRDHRRGTIVGQRSYGKGSVQGIFPLGAGGSGIRLTTAKFYSPTGRAYSDVGVSPDVVVRRAAKPVVDSDDEQVAAAQQEDAVLKAALQIARQRLTQR